MLFYLLWVLLNAALAIYFIAICFKAIKLIRENFGQFASVIFVVGLLSFAGCFNSNDNEGSNSNDSKTWSFISDDSLIKNQTILLEIELKNNLISKYNLEIIYGKDKQLKNNIPISAYSTTEGLTCAKNWKPINIIVERTNNNNKFQYSVYTIVAWKLLGSTVYTQGKNYEGFVYIDSFSKN